MDGVHGSTSGSVARPGVASASRERAETGHFTDPEGFVWSCRDPWSRKVSAFLPRNPVSPDDIDLVLEIGPASTSGTRSRGWLRKIDAVLEKGPKEARVLLEVSPDLPWKLVVHAHSAVLLAGVRECLFAAAAKEPMRPGIRLNGVPARTSARPVDSRTPRNGPPSTGSSDSRKGSRGGRAGEKRAEGRIPRIVGAEDPARLHYGCGLGGRRGRPRQPPGNSTISEQLTGFLAEHFSAIHACEPYSEELLEEFLNLGALHHFIPVELGGE